MQRVDVRKAEITPGCKQLKGRNKGKGDEFHPRRSSKTKANFVASLFSPKLTFSEKQKYRGQTSH